MSLIKEYGFGDLQNKKERTIREQIVERYETVGRQVDAKGKVIYEGLNLLADLEGSVKDNIALMYENTAKLLSETDSSSSGAFETIAFPMVRRIFSKLLANDLVSVQAMTHPAGTLFYFYPNISNRNDVEVGGVVVGKSHNKYMQKKNIPDCITLGANCPDTTFENCKSLYDRYYNNALFDHSKGNFTIITATGAPVQLDSDGCWETPTGAFKSVDEKGGLRSVVMRVQGFDGLNDLHTTARLNGVGGKGLEIDNQEFLASFRIIYTGAGLTAPAPAAGGGAGQTILTTGDEIEFTTLAQRYGKKIVVQSYSDFCDSDGNFYVKMDFETPQLASTLAADLTADNFAGVDVLTFDPADFAFAWRRYDDLEGSSEMGEVTFTIEKVQVSAKPRKLRARWTPELAQDVNAYHNIDAEAELTALLSEQIAMEIDQEILKELRNGAAWKLNWNYDGWRTQGAQKYTEKEWKQTLITKINQISAQIHKSTLRGGANFLVVSTEVSALFDDLENFQVSLNSLEDDTYNLGMKKMGTLSGRYTVYVDPYSRPNDVLIGHKGTSILDTGYIYAPYTPIQLTQTLTDFNDFTSVKGISTRYATEMVNNRYYGKIFVFNIPTFNINELR